MDDADRQVQCSKLLGLPAELQDEIIRNVDRSDFQALLRTCVSLRAAVIPFALNHIVLSGFSPRLDSVVDALHGTISRSKRVADIIRHIQLLCDDTLSTILWKLLPLTTQLKSLDYGWVIVSEKRFEHDIINMRHLGRALSHVKHTLVNLKVTYMVDLPDGYFSEATCGDALLPVKEMVALHKLETTFSILFGPFTFPYTRGAPGLDEILPQGLEELKILPERWPNDHVTRDYERRAGVITDYVCNENWRRFTPKLRLLSYDMFKDKKICKMAWPKVYATEKALEAAVCKNGLQWALELPQIPPVSNLRYERLRSSFEKTKARYV